MCVEISRKTNDERMSAEIQMDGIARYGCVASWLIHKIHVNCKLSICFAVRNATKVEIIKEHTDTADRCNAEEEEGRRMG